MFDIILRFIYRIKIFYFVFKKNYNKALKAFEKLIIKDHMNLNRYRRTNYDHLAMQIGEKIFKQNNLNLSKTIIEVEKPNILILCTEIYDFGGHTELAIRFIKAFNNSFHISFLLSGNGKSIKDTALKKSEIIKQNVKEFIDLSEQTKRAEKIIEIYNYIISSNISTIIVNIHMFDVVSTAVLGLIKKNTNINIIFWNHSDHNYSLATNFADTIITRTHEGKPITKYLINKKNAINFLFLEQTNDSSNYSNEKIHLEKEKIGISENNFVTLTGAPDGKIFSDSKQPYLYLIKNLLEKNPNMKHIIVGSSYEKNKIIVNKIIGNQLLKDKRLIFVDSTPDFDFYIQLSDLYIDSFPQGSALTLIDCIRNSKPVVIKVNEKDLTKSFQMYLNNDYKYSCKTSEEMYEKINTLINDEHEYKKISKMVRNFYLERYSINNVKEQYFKLIK